MKLRLSKLSALLFLLSSFATPRSSAAQHDSGRVEVVQDAKVQLVLNKYQDIHSKKNGKIPGFRVQIHFGTDRAKANEIKSKFITRHLEVPAYAVYEQPNFKVRVGDFRTRLEAYRFMKEIMGEFPASFIVQDEIELPKLDQASGF